MSAYTGYLIRRERLAQNLSQKGLARGICAVSYLSKIEQGLVEPGQEIIDGLFAALHIDFVRDPELEAEARRQFDRFLFLAEADEPYDEQRAFFDAHGERLLRSAFALYVQVFRLIDTASLTSGEATHAILRSIEPFMACLNVPAQRWVLLVKAEFQKSHEDEWAVLEEAARLGESCMVTYKQAVCAHQQGRYGLSAELAERAYSQAAYEGNVATMISSCFLMGTCACNRWDMQQAHRYYDRVFALSRGCRMKMDNYMAYNLGSSYLEMGDEEQALVYLERAGEEESDKLHNLLLHQKLSILYSLKGAREKAQTHLLQAKQWLMAAQWPQEWRRTQLLNLMIRFAELIMTEPLQSGEMERVTRTLYDEGAGQFSFGFKRFYGRYLVEIYKRQRRYKEALAVQEEMAAM